MVQSANPHCAECLQSPLGTPTGPGGQTGPGQAAPAANWLTVPDLANLLNLAGFEVIRSWREVLFPFGVPLLNGFFNRYLAKLGLFGWLDLVNFMVARKKGQPLQEFEAPLVSIIIPTRNEAGNIAELLARTPELGRGSEIIFVDGHSTDATVEVIQSEMAAHPERNCKFFVQSGKGKGDAVRLGYAQASGEMLMILDADISVPPEDLRRFYNALMAGTGDFINGVRPGLPHGKRGHALCQPAGQQVLQSAFLVAARPTGEGYAVRHQSAVEARL